jgi:hypothetical protein
LKDETTAQREKNDMIGYERTIAKQKALEVA